MHEKVWHVMKLMNGMNAKSYESGVPKRRLLRPCTLLALLY